MRQKIKLKEQTALKQWSVEEARELYNILNWGKGFFDINTRGDVVVRPRKPRTSISTSRSSSTSCASGKSVRRC